jgi:hypothetical protein
MGDVKEVELKACPLCEGADIRHEPGQFIACMNINCGCQVDIGSPWGGPKEGGIAFLVSAWNTRPASTGKGVGVDLESISQSAIASAPSFALPGAWRDISTAPKDGTAILASSVNHHAVEVVCWQDGEPSGDIEALLADEPWEGWVNNGSVKDRFYANPLWFTHWMPLPEPPTAQQASKGGAERSECEANQKDRP